MNPRQLVYMLHKDNASCDSQYTQSIADLWKDLPDSDDVQDGYFEWIFDYARHELINDLGLESKHWDDYYDPSVANPVHLDWDEVLAFCGQEHFWDVYETEVQNYLYGMWRKVLVTTCERMFDGLPLTVYTKQLDLGDFKPCVLVLELKGGTYWNHWECEWHGKPATWLDVAWALQERECYQYDTPQALLDDHEYVMARSFVKEHLSNYFFPSEWRNIWNGEWEHYSRYWL